MALFRVGSYTIFDELRLECIFESVPSSPPVTPIANPFHKFPVEIEDFIFNELSIEDLLCLVRTSEAVQHRVTRKIYQNVNISIHRLPRNLRIIFKAACLEDTFAQTVTHSRLYRNLARRQDRFCGTVRDHPEYRDYIKSLIWTARSYRYETETWMLGSMTNIHTLDLCMAPRQPYGESLVRWLLLSALGELTTLRLSGWELFMLSSLRSDSILRALANLVALELDDRFHSISLRPNLDISGLIGCLPRLRRLVIHSFRANYAWPDCNAERYKEWASLINSVRLSIQVLVFEVHGWLGEKNHSEQWSLAGGWFYEYVAPVFKAGPWPRLKYLLVQGLLIDDAKFFLESLRLRWPGDLEIATLISQQERHLPEEARGHWGVSFRMIGDKRPSLQLVERKLQVLRRPLSGVIYDHCGSRPET